MITGMLRPSACADEPRPEGERERGFHKDAFLGKGTYGSVWRVTKKDTGRVYAMKKVDMRNKKQSERFVQHSYTHSRAQEQERERE